MSEFQTATQKSSALKKAGFALWLTQLAIVGLVAKALSAVRVPARPQDRRGAALVEYGLLIALIALVAIGAIVTLGRTLDTKFTEANENILNPAST